MKTIIEMGEAWAKAMARFFRGVNAGLAQRNEEIYEKAYNAALVSGDSMSEALHAAMKRAEESAETVSEALDSMASESERATEGMVSLRKIYRENTNNWRKMHGLPMRRRKR